jgi:hypothetical protein
MKLLNKKKFAALSRNEQRKVICQDVLKRIELDLIKPNSGQFFKNKYSVGEGNQTPQEVVNSKKCEVCAKGALMCSWVGNFNNCDFDSFYNFSEELRDSIRYPHELLAIFGRDMLDNIEAAFENTSYNWHYSFQETQKYTYGFERGDLKGIMEYIIANDGEFPIHESWGLA